MDIGTFMENSLLGGFERVLNMTEYLSEEQCLDILNPETWLFKLI
jgi:hypothetical protein